MIDPKTMVVLLKAAGKDQPVSVTQMWEAYELMLQHTVSNMQPDTQTVLLGLAETSFYAGVKAMMRLIELATELPDEMMEPAVALFREEIEERMQLNQVKLREALSRG